MPFGVLMIVYTDGACLGNPGPMGAGIVFVDKGKTVKELSIPLGKGTNNRAEYLAVIHALKEAKKLGSTTLVLRSDSSLLVKQLRGEYRIKDPKLRELKAEVDSLLKDITVRFEWVSREDNVRADELSKKAAGMKK
jgi:ribonuclease HI